METEKNIMHIIASALSSSGTVNYIVKTYNDRALQIQTKENRHFNILIRDVDRLKGHIIDINQKKGSLLF